VDRRRFLTLAGGVGLGMVAGCAADPTAGRTTVLSEPGIPAAPAALLRPGTATGTLQAVPFEVDFAGTVVRTWGYNASLPGPEIRLRQGETVRVALENKVTDLTTIHWHGIALPNAMDGVPGVTQQAVAPGGLFAYEFTVPDAGSFMYHAHVGHQLDMGLYGPLIVEARDEPGDYDREYTLMLDDWRDGYVAGAGDGHDDHGGTPAPTVTPTATPTATPTPAPTPSAAPADAEPNGGPRMGGRFYPLYLVNGRPAADPQTLEVRRGERIRLRVMNISSDTGYRFAIAGHRLRVTHTDGMPVSPVTVDVLRLGMGERYDVLVEADNPGAWQVAVMPEAKTGFGRAVLRYTDAPSARAPEASVRPDELDGRMLSYAELHYTGARAFASTTEPDREYAFTLTTNRIDGVRFDAAQPLTVSAGQVVRISMRNTSSMWHPMHLHGHHFRVVVPGGGGPVKDTMLVPAGGIGTLDFRTDNAGDWMFHCHNHYHMENGMARLVRYA
jgi:FtsP/CotA-like multicopper oxidase with cupredoxin domain